MKPKIKQHFKTSNIIIAVTTILVFMATLLSGLDIYTKRKILILLSFILYPLTKKYWTSGIVLFFAVFAV